MSSGGSQALSLVLLERNLLAWMTGITGLGLVLWVVSLSTHYWLVGVSPITNLTTVPHVVWSYSSLWEVCRVERRTYSDLVVIQCRNHLVSAEDEDIVGQVRTELILSGVSILLMVMGMGFSSYSLLHPKYVYKRLAAALHLITAGIKNKSIEINI